MKNTRYIHGGCVYRESIKKMLGATDPELVVDEVFVHKQRNHYWRLCLQVCDLLTSQFSHYPAKVKHFMTGRFRAKVKSAMAERPYAFFVINGAEMLWALELLPQGALVLYISHNIEHSLYEQQVARYARVPWLGGLLRDDAEKFKRFEIDHIKRIRKIITIAAADQKVLSGYCPEARIVTILPSFDYAHHERRPNPCNGPLRLGFLGNLEWWPNRRSLQWFLKEVWPQVSDNKLELHLYGQGSIALTDIAKRVHGHGFVRDLTQVWEGVDLMIQPITCGAGINIKVAESLYNRMPIVATPLAIRGIQLADDPAIKIIADADGWIAYLNGPLPVSQAGLMARQENADLFDMATNVKALKDLLAGIDGYKPIPGRGEATCQG